jgi:hypothetical protein
MRLLASPYIRAEKKMETTEHSPGHVPCWKCGSKHPAPTRSPRMEGRPARSPADEVPRAFCVVLGPAGTAPQRASELWKLALDIARGVDT